MSDYLNSQNTRLMDPATPGLVDGDTVTLANGAKFVLVSGRWEPVSLGGVSKQQLVTATHSGSGTGFVAIEDGKDITTVLKEELSEGKRVRVYGVGTAYISDTLYLKSGLDLEISSGVTLKQAPGTNKTMFKCDQFAAPPTPVTLAWSSGYAVSVTWAAHGKGVGDAIWLYGSGQSKYNGVFYVTSVTDANTLVIALHRIPTVAPTGTIYGVSATQDVRISCSGVIDYDYANNSSASATDKFAIILGGANIVVTGINGRNALKYVMALGAIRDFRVLNMHSDSTPSDGIKVYGPAFDGEIRGVSGCYGDDCVSFQTLEPSAYIAYQFSRGGDVIGVKAYQINPAKTTTGVFKLYPSTNEYMDDCGVDGASVGDCPSINYSLYAPFNNAQVGHVWFKGLVGNSPTLNVFKTLGNPGLTVRHLEIDTVYGAYGSTANVIEIGSQIVAGVLSVKRLYTKTGNSSSLALGGTIGMLIFEECNAAGIGANVGRIITSSASMNLTRAVLRSNKAAGNETLFFTNTGVAGPVIVDLIDNVVNLPSLIQIGQSGSVVNLLNNTVTGATSGMVRARDNGTIEVNDLGGNTLVSGSYLAKQSGGEVISINGCRATVDVTAIARKDGAIIYNTNGSAGSLGAPGLVICQGAAAGSWKLLADTTKTY